jgi:hypothetical protein
MNESAESFSGHSCLSVICLFLSIEFICFEERFENFHVFVAS